MVKKGGVAIIKEKVIDLFKSPVFSIIHNALIIAIIIVSVILVSKIPFRKIMIIANFNNNYEIFSSSIKAIEELEDITSINQVIELPKKYKKLSYKGKVSIYKNGKNKYISFMQIKNYVDRSYIQIVYTKNNINDLKYYIYYNKIEFKKIKDNWYYIYVEKNIHDKYIPLGYYKIVKNNKRTYNWCFQDIDTCYVSYDKYYYKNKPNLVLNSLNGYEKIDVKNKAKVIYKVFQFERSMNDGKGTLKYDFLMSTISKNDYIHIEEHDWSYELYLYDIDNNILYRFHGYD